MPEEKRLDRLRIDLDKTDRHIVALLAKRLEIARRIEGIKFSNGDPIVAEKTELDKLAKLDLSAHRRGLSIPFVNGIFYNLFGESCRIQVKQRDLRDQKKSPSGETAEERYQRFQSNLINLTETLLPGTGGNYNIDSFGTLSYMEFEKEALQREIGTLKAIGNTGIAVDLGCGVGMVTFELTPHFDEVVAIDISKAMISQATFTQKCLCQDTSKAKFIVGDIEKRLPLPDNSVSFVAMTLGTGSDIHDIRRVLSSIHRVLNKNGRFLLSFYNSAALFYRWSLPWQTSLMAEIDPIEHCLEVRAGEKVFQLYAKPYTKREVKKIINGAQLRVSSICTYPALAAILPNELFYGADEAQRAPRQHEAREALRMEVETRKNIQFIDKSLANTDMGAYILVTGRKP